MPTTGLTIMPSGLALTQVMLKSWVTVAAAVLPTSQLAMAQTVKKDKDMAMVGVELARRPCEVSSKQQDVVAKID